MSFTYTSNPLTSTIDAVRVEMGDTLVNQHEVEDEEILYAYEKEGTVVKAAARLCEMLAAKYAKREVFRGATVQSEKVNVSEKFRQMAKVFRTRGIRAGSFIMPSMSKSSKSDNETDTDAVQPSFKRGMHDNPEVEADADLGGDNIVIIGET